MVGQRPRKWVLVLARGVVGHLLMVTAGAAAWGQEPVPQRLPAVVPNDIEPEPPQWRPYRDETSFDTVIPAAFPQALKESVVEETADGLDYSFIQAHKNGFFQRVDFTGTWIHRPRQDDYGVSSLELSSTFGLPAPRPDMPLILTPGFAAHYVDGPPGQDVPPRLYDAYLSLRWMGQINDRWAFNVGVTPGVYSDFEQWDDRAIRITGYGFAVYVFGPQFKLLLGVAYLDRDDVSLLPAAGFIWKPSDLVTVEAILPRPKIAVRIDPLLPYGEGNLSPCLFEDWLYVAAEFGGGSYFYQRLDGSLDTLTLRDYRALLGVERKKNGGAGARLEIGWVFGREIDFSGATSFPGDSTVLLRGGVTY